MIIRICTEDKNSERVRELCAKRFDAFTIYRGMGAWKGKLEPSLTIEIAVIDEAGYYKDQDNAKSLAYEIKDLNAQDAVLMEYIASTNVLI
jgi:hypothetical protein